VVKGECVEMSAVSTVKDERSEINTSGRLLGTHLIVCKVHQTPDGD